MRLLTGDQGTPARFDPLAASRPDPYPSYARLRAEDPVHESHLGLWVISLFDDVVACLRHPGVRAGGFFDGELRRFALAVTGVEKVAWDDSSVLAAMHRAIPFLDPPDHPPLRSALAAPFRTASTRLRPPVARVVAELLAAPVQRGTIDVVAEVAEPVPTMVMMELLRLPLADRPQLERWCEAIARMLDPLLGPLQLRAAEAAMTESLAYLGAALDERRRSPGEDLLSDLASCLHHGVGRDELLTNILFFLGAGHETVKNAIASGVLQLLRHPDQLAGVRDSPERWPAAVEEVLRFDAPIQLVARRTDVALQLRGGRVPAGARLLLLLGAANHDPARFADPDRFDVGRAPLPSLAFGSGIHHCFGAALARVEVEETLRALLGGARSYVLADRELRWRRSLSLRGLQMLTLTQERSR